MFADRKDCPIFTKENKVKLFLKYRNRWVDYCPCDGVSLNDENALWSFVTFTYNGFYYCIVKPKMNNDYNKRCIEYKNFSVYKFKLNEIYKSANDFNNGTFIYVVNKLEFNDESLFMMLITDYLIYENIVNNENELNFHHKKFMKNIDKF